MYTNPSAGQIERFSKRQSRLKCFLKHFTPCLAIGCSKIGNGYVKGMLPSTLPRDYNKT